MSQDIAIAVVTHKQFSFSLPTGYTKMQVNCKLNQEHWDGYWHDDSGENISEKNPSYCELTGLYWLWKNSNANIKGLCHYRRYFCNDPTQTIYYRYWTTGETLYKECMKSETIHSILKVNDIILPMPFSPYPRTAREDLLFHCFEKDVDILSNVIHDFYPDYEKAYHSVMNSHNICYCNMMIAKRHVFDDYCQWIFSVLAQCEKRCNIDDYDTQHKRIYGFLAEVLLNVYIEKNELTCAYVRNVFVSDFFPTLPKKDERSSYITEKIMKVVYRLKVDPLVEIIFKKLRPEKYDAYAQYKKWLNNKSVTK